MKTRLGLVLLTVMLAVAGCRKEAEVAVEDDYVFEPVRIAAAYLTAMEKPDASRALLLGDEAKKLSPYLARAGIRADVRGERYDLIVVSCEEMSRASCAKVTSMLTRSGVLVWLMDVRGVSAERFHARLDAFDLPDVRLWMPGEHRWLLVGRQQKVGVKLSSMLEVFARESAFEDLAKAGCGTVPELFASYAGSREDLLPAFSAGDQSAIVKPEFYLTREIPSVDWLRTDGVDDDIAGAILSEIRSMQVIRRLAVEGNMLSLQATDKKGEEAAADKWRRAILRNPHELFVLERLDRLERNAKGFLSLGKVLQAMKCYETMVLVNPTAVSVHNFGMCLKRIGKLDLAEKVLKRAKELEK